MTQPSIPTSFTIRSGQSGQLTWNLTDPNNNPVSGATVTASVYENRSRTNPVVTPGTVVPGLSPIGMVETPLNSGIYIGTFAPQILSSSAVTNYVTVITARDSLGTLLSQWEIPTVVPPPQNNLDLVLLDDVKSWLGIKSGNTDDDETIQICITGFSQYVLNRTGRSSFTAVDNYIETYDGNGNMRLFLKNYPITVLNSVQIGAYTVPFSTSLTVPGIYIEQSTKSIAFRFSTGTLLPPQNIYPYRFERGQGNILVNYMAGYAEVPFDLYEAAMKAVAINYRRKDWIDMASKSISTGGGATGTTRYRDWTLPPDIERVLTHYQRRATI